MDKINLTASKKSQQDLTANQFQEKLYNWFREQGLLSELRGHLRMQMVSALQDGSPSTSRQFSISPKVQALTVLTADFLLHQGYTYTLSVLVTEVPLIGQMFSQFSHSTIKDALESGNLLLERFSARDVEDILETLGLVSGSELSRNALTLYQDNSNSDPLLLCVMRSLTKSNVSPWKEPRLSLMENFKEQKNVDGVNALKAGDSTDRECCNKNKEGEAAQGKDVWMQEMANILLQNNIKLGHISHIQNYMKRIHEAEMWRIREEETAKFQAMMEEKRQEDERRRSQEKHLVGEWREQVEAEISEREKNLCKLADQLRMQHEEITDKLYILETESEKMKLREKQLIEQQERGSKEIEEKKSEAEVQKSKIDEAFKRLAADQEAISREKEELESRKKVKEDGMLREKDVQQEKDSQKEFVYLRQIQEQYSGLCQLLSSIQTASADAKREQNGREDKSLQTSPPPPPTPTPPQPMAVAMATLPVEPELVHRVEEEKRELREHVIQQRRRIDELTMRAADLANQLQDAQVALQLVNPHQLTVTVPQLTAPPTARLYPRPSWPPHIGSGEETSFPAMHSGTRAAALVPPPPTVSTTSTAVAGTLTSTSRTDASVRRRTRRAVRPLNSSDDSTTTDEMIEEARQRLRQLEEESTAVRQNYQDFRARQTLENSGPAMLFHPEQSRAQNVFDYHASDNNLFGGQNAFRGARNATRCYTTRLGSVPFSRPVFDSFQPGYNQNRQNKGFRSSAILRKGTDGGEEVGRYQFPKYVRKPIPINTTSPTDSSSAFPNLSKKILQNSLKHFTTDSNGRGEIIKAMKKSRSKTRTYVESESPNGVSSDEKEDGELNELQSEQNAREQDALISEIKEKISHRKEMLKKSKEENEMVHDCANDKKPKSLKFSKTVTILENDSRDNSDSEGGRLAREHGRNLVPLRGYSSTMVHLPNPSSECLEEIERCSILLENAPKGKSCTNFKTMTSEEESVEVLLQRSMKSSSTTVPMQCEYYCSESDAQDERADVGLASNHTFSKPAKHKALSLPTPSAKAFSLTDETSVNKEPNGNDQKESDAKESESNHQVATFISSPRDSNGRPVRTSLYDTSYLSERDSQNRIAPLFSTMSPRESAIRSESAMNRVASFISTNNTPRNHQVSPKKSSTRPVHSTNSVSEPCDSFALIGSRSAYEEPISPRSTGEPATSEVSRSRSMSVQLKSKSDDSGEARLVPLLNFEQAPYSAIMNQSESGMESNVTDRGGTEDSWREPGDGTDCSKPDSDDPVSAGTQGSSGSSNSFW